MKISRWFGALAVATVIWSAVPAQSFAYTTKGAGECSTWVGGLDDRFWVLGYITGHNNALDKDVGQNVAPDKIYKFVTRYCQENPADDLDDAMSSYVRTQ